VVLDVGTGSGVLAIAAALLGAAQVVAIDLDPAARDVARRNAADNHVDRIVRVVDEQVDQLERLFDVVVANIDAPTLAGLAPVLVNRLAPAGRLVVSGVLVEQSERVDAALRRAGALEVVDERTLDGWVATAWEASSVGATDGVIAVPVSVHVRFGTA
jgi:ribosomal protein L11 methyltransferase